MPNLNRCDFMGNCGSDPELRYTQSGTPVAKLSIACNEKWKDKQTGEQKERTEWVNLEFWGRLAEIAGEYLKKGNPVYVSGSLQTDKYDAKDGSGTRYFTKVKVREMQLLSSREAQPRRQPNDYADAKAGEKLGPPPAATPQQDFDDDIPF